MNEKKLEKNLKTSGISNSVMEYNAERLKKIVSEIEDLNRDKKSIDRDINSLFTTAELMGFSKKILKKVISFKQKPQEEIEEEELAFQQMWELLK